MHFNFMAVLFQTFFSIHYLCKIDDLENRFHAVIVNGQEETSNGIYEHRLQSIYYNLCIAYRPFLKSNIIEAYSLLGAQRILNRQKKK